MNFNEIFGQPINIYDRLPEVSKGKFTSGPLLFFVEGRETPLFGHYHINGYFYVESKTSLGISFGVAPNYFGEKSLAFPKVVSFCPFPIK